MPYIIQENRQKYKSQIQQVVDFLNLVEDDIERAEYFYMFVDAIRVFYLQSSELNDTSDREEVGSDYSMKDELDSNKLSFLMAAARDFVSKVNTQSLLLKKAGEFNYIISSVNWGILEGAGYGLRSFVSSLICRIFRDIPDDTREEIMFSGMLDDVCAEVYRRKTAIYEDEKIAENGDIWTDGKLS